MIDEYNFDDTESNLAELRAERDAALAEAAGLRAVVEMVEWQNTPIGEVCIWRCEQQERHLYGGRIKIEHAPDCPRQLALSASRRAGKAAAVLAASKPVAELLAAQTVAYELDGLLTDPQRDRIRALLDAVRALDGAGQP